MQGPARRRWTESRSWTRTAVGDRWEALQSHLHWGSRLVRLAAMRALTALAPEAAVPHLYAAREDLSLEIRRTARDLLAGLDLNSSALLRILGAALDAADPSARAGAVAGLVSLGKTALPTIRQALGSVGALEVHGALEVVRGLGSDAASLQPRILRGLQEFQEPDLIVAALDAVTAMGVADKRTVKTLLEVVRDRPKQAPKTIRVLGALADDSRVAANALRSLVADVVYAPDARTIALRVLDAGDMVDVDFLRESLGALPEEVSNAAVPLLARRGAGVVRDVKKDLQALNKQRRVGAMRVLKALGADAKSAVKPLMLIYADTYNDERFEAVGALIAIGKPSVKPLLEFMKGADAKNVAWTAGYLGQIGREADAARPPSREAHEEQRPGGGHGRRRGPRQDRSGPLRASSKHFGSLLLAALGGLGIAAWLNALGVFDAPDRLAIDAWMRSQDVPPSAEVALGVLSEEDASALEENGAFRPRPRCPRRGGRPPDPLRCAGCRLRSPFRPAGRAAGRRCGIRG